MQRIICQVLIQMMILVYLLVAQMMHQVTTLIFLKYDANGDGYEASNYNPDANIDNGSCIIIGCTINTWYICPESYNPNATINDWMYFYMARV